MPDYYSKCLCWPTQHCGHPHDNVFIHHALPSTSVLIGPPSQVDLKVSHIASQSLLDMYREMKWMLWYW